MEFLRRFGPFKKTSSLSTQPQGEVERTSPPEEQGDWGRTLGLMNKEKIWSNAPPIGFSTDAMNVLFNAVRIARDEWRDDRIEPHHIVMALFADERAGGFLRKFDVNPDKFRSTVEFVTGKPHRDQRQTIDFSYRAKKVLEIARRLAFGVDDREATSLDLLAGVIKEGFSIGFSILAIMGMDDQMIAAIQKVRIQQQEADAAIDYVKRILNNTD